ncbi:MAG: type II 3-dehydroquinate dehydratase [candidate division WOR-3 bacterium]
MQMRVLVINGPNLNLLGEREPGVYGTMTLQEIEGIIRSEANRLGAEVSFLQSNSESEITSAIHEAREKFDGILINPASFTHYSVAIADAIGAIKIPVVEVHISNILAREEFRARSITARACRGVITGFGPLSYILGLHALKHILCE